MRRRPVLWSLLAAYLIVVGLWSTAAAPVSLATAGLDTVLGSIPRTVLVLAAGVAWLIFRPGRTARPATA